MYTAVLVGCNKNSPELLSVSTRKNEMMKFIFDKEIMNIPITMSVGNVLKRK